MGKKKSRRGRLRAREGACAVSPIKRCCGRGSMLLPAVLLLALVAASCADSHINVRGQYDFSAAYVKGLHGR
jgi:hypothetical protein